MLENFDAFLDIIAKIIALASAFCAITPTPESKKIYAAFYRIVDFLALNIIHAKEK